MKTVIVIDSAGHCHTFKHEAIWYEVVPASPHWVHICVHRDGQNSIVGSFYQPVSVHVEDQKFAETVKKI